MHFLVLSDFVLRGLRIAEQIQSNRPVAWLDHKLELALDLAVVVLLASQQLVGLGQRSGAGNLDHAVAARAGHPRKAVCNQLVEKLGIKFAADLVAGKQTQID